MPLTDFHPWLLTCLLAPFGLVFGSFANVLIHRLPQEAAEDRDVVAKPSHCPSCGEAIRWFHNVPLLSWAWLRGRCAQCGWAIPVRYPLVELLAGALFGLSPWIFPFGTLIWLKGLVCGYALIVLFFTDLTTYILPNVVQFPLMAVGLLFALPDLFWPAVQIGFHSGQEWGASQAMAFYNGLQPAPLWGAYAPPVGLVGGLLGLCIGYAFPWAFNFGYVKIRNAVVARVSGGKPLESGMGMGDFKMLAWLGAFWGWQSMLGILFVAVALMCAFVLPIHLLRRRGGGTMYPLGCGLALATPIVVFWGPLLWRAYQSAMP